MPIEYPHVMDFQVILDTFSIADLKPFQKNTLIEALISQKDVYMSVKTGGGKSLLSDIC